MHNDLALEPKARHLSTLLVVRNVALFALAKGINVSCISLILTSSKLIGQAYSENPITHTMPIGFMMLGMVIFSFPASGLARRFGRKQAFLIGSLLVMLGAGITALMMSIGQWWGIQLGLFFVGFGTCFGEFYPFAANDQVPAKYHGRVSGAILLGGICAAFIGPQAARIAGHYETEIPMIAIPFTLLVFGIVLLCLISFLRLSVDQRDSGSPWQKQVMGALIKSKRFWGAALIGATGYGAMTLVMNATTPWMFSRGMTIDHSSMVVSAHLLGMFVPAPLSGMLADRMGASKVGLAGSVVLGVSLLTLALGQELWDFYISLTLLGVGWSMMVVAGTKLIIKMGQGGMKASAEAGNVMLASLANIAAAMSAAMVFYTLGGIGVLLISSAIILLGTAAALSTLILYK